MALLSNAGCGVWDSATSLWIVELWPVKNSAVLQINQFAFGFGTIVGPLLAAPFLYGTATEFSVEDFTGSGNKSSTVIVPLTMESRRNSVAVPFVIAGLIQALGKL